MSNSVKILTLRMSEDMYSDTLKPYKTLVDPSTSQVDAYLGTVLSHWLNKEVAAVSIIYIELCHDMPPIVIKNEYKLHPLKEKIIINKRPNKPIRVTPKSKFFGGEFSLGVGSLPEDVVSFLQCLEPPNSEVEMG